jgi:hypothetical protein
MPVEDDLLRRLAEPALAPIHAAVSTTVLPAPVRDALSVILDSTGLLAIMGLLVVAASIGARISSTRRRDVVHRTVAVASTLVAAALGAWILSHPSPRFDDFFKRWDHMAFAGCAGVALASFGHGARKWALAIVSLGVLAQYAGPLAVGVAVALTGVAVALLRTSLRSNIALTVVAQAMLIVAVYGYAFWLRGADFFAAASVQGLLAFWVLRHISLVVASIRGAPPSLADCAAFMSFYPGAMGLLCAPEVYDEFARRNLVKEATLNHQHAFRRLAEGVLLLAAGMLVPVSLESVKNSPTTIAAWMFAIVLFVRSALSIMGVWRSVEATALLYGVRMRANFSGLLSCRNPSELWWAWRGTLTNWLVQYVYAPLGASRRHQSLNILAAFAVSFVWHAMGVPFLTPGFRLIQIAPVALWAAVNALAVVAHVRFSRAAPASATAVPAPLRIAVATVLMWALGSLTPILLSYQGAAVDQLPSLLRLLLGLR